MMFNIPLPGGTTGHAVGGTLLAITLGPWAAVIGVSVVLGIQALFFGDGGLIAFGANCFNMAIVLPLVGYFIYKVISADSEATSTRRLVAAVLASYMALAVAALLTAIEFGLQPHFFHAADGTPLYCPYGLDEAMPAMMIGHLLVACPVEALATGMVFAFLQRTHSSLIKADVPAKKEGKIWLLWGALALAALATPIGLLASGTAWGEWGGTSWRAWGWASYPAVERFAEWWPALARLRHANGGRRRLCPVRFHRHGPGGCPHLAVGPGAPPQGPATAGRAIAVRDAPREQQRFPVEEHLRRYPGPGIGDCGRDLSGMPGLLQGLEPIKVATILLFIVVVGLVHDLAILAGISGWSWLLACCPGCLRAVLLRRILIFIPLFTAVIAIPALFITPGDPW